MSLPNLTVLLYHRITEDGVKKPHAIEVSKFRNQMQWLRRSGFEVITMDRARAALFDEAPLSRRSVVITFDDGFSDFGDHALKVLTEFKYPSLVYVVAGLLGQRAAWLNEGDRFGDERILSQSQLRELSASKVEIGSHTLSHPFLHLLSPEDQLDEIRRSKGVLEDVIGTEVKSFAYPYGVYNPEVAGRVQTSGYDNASTVNRGSAYHSPSPFEISRKAISAGDSMVGFFHKLLWDNSFKRRPKQGLTEGHHYP